MIDVDAYKGIVDRLRALTPYNGFTVDQHIAWSEQARPPESPEQFAIEAIFVICNSGMKHTIARRIFDRIEAALREGEPTSSGAREQLGLTPIFNHHGKTSAIDRIWLNRDRYFDGFMAAEDKVLYCGSMPHIGEVTKFHLAKNFGADVAKPDVHLVRLAEQHGTTPQLLCADLAAQLGCKVRTVDLVLWMACARGVINSRTGAMAA